MKKCPKCNIENRLENAQFCQKCGATLTEQNIVQTVNSSNPDDDLEFEVTETADSEAPQLFGTRRVKNTTNDEDSLDIEDNSNLLGDDTAENIIVPSESDIATDKLPLNIIEKEITPSADPGKLALPEELKKPEKAETAKKPENAEKAEKAKETKKLEKSEPCDVDWGATPKQELEVPSLITNNYKQSKVTPSSDDFSKSRSELTDNNKKQNKPAQTGSFKSTKVNAPKTNQPQPVDSKITKSARVRGIAYFYKNIIQLAGTPFLHENDEISFKGKPYRLKRYQISKKYKLISMAALFLLLSIAIGSQIIGPALPGHGQIVGLILDDSGQPYLSGANIYIPELDKSITSNAQGFFRFDEVPTGSYELVYRLGNELQGKENITVTSGSLIMRSFGDFELMEEQYEYSASQKVLQQEPAPVQAALQPAKKTTSKKSSGTNKSSGYGKIKLVANVEGAKFVVDGKTLGAGNNTFGKIKSGKRKITVSKPGYTEYAEIVTVSRNKTKTVKANLSRRAAEAEQSLTANDYYGFGKDAFVAEKYASAIGELTKAIELSPNHIDAYTKRAQSYVALGKNNKAADDYIRAGEIYSFKNQNGLAITQFTSALKYSKNNTTALVGRAGARMNKGEYRSALIDYTMAIEIDKKFFPAHRGAGIAEFKLGDNKNAEKHLRKAKKLNNSDPQLYHYLMLNYLARDNIKQMKKAYAQYKNIAGSRELAEFKSSTRFAPVIRLISDDKL